MQYNHTCQNENKKMLHWKSWCFVCTKKGNQSRDYKSKNTSFCGKWRHHTSICKKDKDGSGQQACNGETNDPKTKKNAKGDQEHNQ